MTEEKPSGTYSVHLTGPLAEEIERDADRRGVSKSKAMRALLEDGQRHRSDIHRFFERAALQAVSVLLAATLTVVVSLAVVALATLSGATLGLSPRSIMELGGITATMLLLTALATWALYRLGVAERIDDLVASLAQWLGIEA